MFRVLYKREGMYRYMYIYIYVYGCGSNLRCIEDQHDDG